MQLCLRGIRNQVREETLGREKSGQRDKRVIDRQTDKHFLQSTCFLQTPSERAPQKRQYAAGSHIIQNRQSPDFQNVRDTGLMATCNYQLTREAHVQLQGSGVALLGLCAE